MSAWLCPSGRLATCRVLVGGPRFFCSLAATVWLR